MAGRKKGSYKPFYKDRYILALYDIEDNLIQVFDNIHQLADWLDSCVKSISCSVSRMLSGGINYMFHKNQKYKVHAIEIKKGANVNAKKS